MYGSVLGTSVAASSVAVLPNTGASKLSLVISLALLTAGVAIVAVSVSRALAAKAFNG